MGEVLHVEIARKTNSILRRKEILNLVKNAVDNIENPVRDFCIHDHRHLFDHVECIKLCSYSNTWKTCRSDEKYADSEKKAHSLLSRFSTPTVIKKEYYMFKLFEAGENEENLEESISNDGPRASHHWILPSRQFQQEWETLVFEPSVKARLLDYMKMAIIYSQKHVNDSLIAWSKVVLIHGPPGTGKTTLCKAFAHKATIRLGGHFDYGQLIEINSNSLFSKYFSESGKLIERMFSKIHDLLEDRRSIVFLHIDEVESLATSRKNATGSLASDNIRAVNCLLTQLDKIKRYPNLVILTTSNIVDSIDVAFVDRADIKLCIGNPSADLIYQIYAGSINELIRCDIVQTKPDYALLPPTIQTIDSADPFYENAQKLWNISVSSVNLSGRTLKRIPFLTHCNYVKSFDGGCGLEEYLDGMILAVEKEKSEVQIITENFKSDKSKTVHEEFPQFVAVVKNSAPSSCTSPCVTSSTKTQEKKFTASSVSSNFSSGGSKIYSSSSSDSDAESYSRSNSQSKFKVSSTENGTANKLKTPTATVKKAPMPSQSTSKLSVAGSSSSSPGRPRSTPGPKSSKEQPNGIKGRTTTTTANESEAEAKNPSPFSKQKSPCKSKLTKPVAESPETKCDTSKKSTPDRKRSRKTPTDDESNNSSNNSNNSNTNSNNATDPGKFAVPHKRQKCEKNNSVATTPTQDIDERRMKRLSTKYQLHPLYIDLSKSTCTSNGVLIPFQTSKNKKSPSSQQPIPICVSLENFENDPIEIEMETETEIKDNHIGLDQESNPMLLDDPPFDERPPTPTPCVPIKKPNSDLGNSTPYAEEEARNNLISRFLEPLSPLSKSMMGPPMTPRNQPCKDDDLFKLDVEIEKPTTSRLFSDQGKISDSEPLTKTASPLNLNINFTNSASFEIENQQKTPEQKQNQAKHQQEKKQEQEKEKQLQKPTVKESPQPKILKRVALNGASPSLKNPGKTTSVLNSGAQPQTQQSKSTQIKAVASISTPTATTKTTTATTTTTLASTSTESILKSSAPAPKMIKKTRKRIQKVIRVRAGPVRLIRKVKPKTSNETPTPSSQQPQLHHQPSSSTSKSSLTSSSSTPVNPNGVIIAQSNTKNTIKGNPPTLGTKSVTLTQSKPQLKPATVNAIATANSNANTNTNVVALSKKDMSEKSKPQQPNNSNSNKNSLSTSPPLFSTFDKIKTAAERKMVVKQKSPQKKQQQQEATSSASRKPSVSISKPDTNNTEHVESSSSKTSTKAAGMKTQETENPGFSGTKNPLHDTSACKRTKETEIIPATTITTRIDLSDAKRLRLDFKVFVLNEPENQSNQNQPESKSKSTEPASLTNTKSAQEQEKAAENSVMEFSDRSKLICSHCNTEFPQNHIPNLLERETGTEDGGTGHFQPKTCSNCGKERDAFSCSLCGLLFNTEEEVEEHESTCLQSIDTPPPIDDSDTGSVSDELVLGRCGWAASSLFPIITDAQANESVYGTSGGLIVPLPSPSGTDIGTGAGTDTFTSSSSPSFCPGSNQMPSSVSSQASDGLSIPSEFASPMSSFNNDPLLISACLTPHHNNNSHNSSPNPGSTLSVEQGHGHGHGHRYGLTSPSPAHTPTHRQNYPSPRVTPPQTQTQSQSQQQPFMSLNDLTGALLDSSISINPTIREAVEQHFSLPPMPPLLPMPRVPASPSASVSVSGSNFHTCRFCHRCFISVQEMRQHVVTFHAGPVPAQLPLPLETQNEGQCNSNSHNQDQQRLIKSPAHQSQAKAQSQEINGHSADEQSQSQNQNEMYLNHLDHQEASDFSQF